MSNFWFSGRKSINVKKKAEHNGALVEYPIVAISVFLWIGFVGAISFMEAWLKFQAPGVDLAIGLGIGRLVFGALNKVEWVFATTIIISYLLGGFRLNLKMSLTMGLILLLLVQTVYLLPALDHRAELIIQGLHTEPSGLHLQYILAEVLKLLLLLVLGICQFSKIGVGK